MPPSPGTETAGGGAPKTATGVGMTVSSGTAPGMGGSAPAMSPTGLSGPAGPRPEVSAEPLGSQAIEGVLVEGTRRTTTFAVGMVGNDRPIAAVSETWFSPELKVVVLSRSLDPRYGESVTRLTNISRAEPDPGLFQVPADYQIVDETGPFTIKITRP